MYNPIKWQKSLCWPQEHLAGTGKGSETSPRVDVALPEFQNKRGFFKLKVRVCHHTVMQCLKHIPKTVLSSNEKYSILTWNINRFGILARRKTVKNTAKRKGSVGRQG